MAVQRQLWADAVEYDAGFLGRCVVIQYQLYPLVERQHFLPCGGHFVNDDIRSLGGLDEVFVEPGIARHDHRAARVVHAIAVGGLDVLTVVHGECGDRYAVLVEYDAICGKFTDIEFDPLER